MPGRTKSATFFAYNVDKDSEHFTIYVSVDMIFCAQASIPIEDKRIDHLLLGLGLNLVRDKIIREIIEDEKRELLYEDIINIDNKINKLKLSEAEYKLKYRIQKDILSCLYREKAGRGATSKELVDYVWCDSELLSDELWHLNRIKLISTGPFSKELLDKGGDSDDTNINRMVHLTTEGKQRYETMMEQDILNMNSHLQPFKNWVPFASNKKIFLAHKFDEKELRDKVEEELIKIGFELKEGRVEDLGYISEDILNKIKESGFFMALLTKARKFEQGNFSTSTWVLMEIGSAIAFERKVAILAEDCVEQEEYASKLQRDCQYETFNRSNFSERLNTVINRIKKQWEKHRGG